MAEQLKFRMDWGDFYNKLNDKQKAHFLELISKHMHNNIYEIIDVMEDLKVIVQ